MTPSSCVCLSFCHTLAFLDDEMAQHCSGDDHIFNNKKEEIDKNSFEATISIHRIWPPCTFNEWNDHQWWCWWPALILASSWPPRLFPSLNGPKPNQSICCSPYNCVCESLLLLLPQTKLALRLLEKEEGDDFALTGERKWKILTLFWQPNPTRKKSSKSNISSIKNLSLSARKNNPRAVWLSGWCNYSHLESLRKEE